MYYCYQCLVKSNEYIMSVNMLCIAIVKAIFVITVIFSCLMCSLVNKDDHKYETRGWGACPSAPWIATPLITTLLTVLNYTDDTSTCESDLPTVITWQWHDIKLIQIDTDTIEILTRCGMQTAAAAAAVASWRYRDLSMRTAQSSDEVNPLRIRSPFPADFHNLTRTSLSRNTSVIQFSRRSDVFPKTLVKS